eukprot:5190116-Amphidinium_carterae.1
MALYFFWSQCSFWSDLLCWTATPQNTPRIEEGIGHRVSESCSNAGMQEAPAMETVEDGRGPGAEVSDSSPTNVREEDP